MTDRATRRPRVLFLCTGNSCRSQIAEGYARKHSGDGLDIYSAGTHPTIVNPRAIEVMNEVGVDLSSHVSKGLQAVPRDVDYVITLCGDAAEHCPILPARIHVENWDLPDPAKATGTSGQILAVFRNVRDEIERRIKERVRGWMAGDRQ